MGVRLPSPGGDGCSMNTLSSHRPRPSIEMRTPAAARAGEGGAGELAALVRVEDLGPAEARQRTLEGRDAERAGHIGSAAGFHGLVENRPAEQWHRTQAQPRYTASA
jgi:hypothetical protein